MRGPETVQPPIAERMQGIQPFHVMALLARARQLEAQGRDIVHMEIGEPDFSTPERVVDAGIKALKDGKTHYTPALGLPALRQRIADYYGRQYGCELDARRVIITPGSSGALQLIMGVLVNPGDEVLMADPGYPCNRHFVEYMGGVPRMIPVDEKNNFQLSRDLLQQNWSARARAAMIASPANPTGTLVAEQALKDLAAFCQQHNAALIADEIYHGLVYEQKPMTAAALPGSVFVVNSFSKYFGMTGWRIGWMIAPPDYVDALDRLAQNLFLATSTPAQYAAMAALEEDSLVIYEERREIFRQRRDYLLEALSQLGFGIAARPQGAFYIYADCSMFTDDSYAFCQNLLEEQGLAVTPGMDFGSHQAARYLRFAYTVDVEKLKIGVEKLTKYLKKK